jgi:GTP 3',8-cyclase
MLFELGQLGHQDSVGRDLQPALDQELAGGGRRVQLEGGAPHYTCLFATAGHDLRALVRGGASDARLAVAVRQIWEARDDRYSEIRTGETVKLPKVEMSYIGG